MILAAATETAHRNSPNSSAQFHLCVVDVCRYMWCILISIQKFITNYQCAFFYYWNKLIGPYDIGSKRNCTSAGSSAPFDFYFDGACRAHTERVQSVTLYAIYLTCFNRQTISSSSIMVDHYPRACIFFGRLVWYITICACAVRPADESNPAATNDATRSNVSHSVDIACNDGHDAARISCMYA